MPKFISDISVNKNVDTTSVNKVNITQPLNGSTLTIADGKTFEAKNTITISGVDNSTLNIGNGGTLGSGAFANKYVLPTATANTLGGVKIGTGIGISSGTISVTYGAIAGTSVEGNDVRLSDARVPLEHEHDNSYLSKSTTSIQNGYFGDIHLYDDVSPSHYLKITNADNLTGARTLSLNINNTDRTISLKGNLTLANSLTTIGNYPLSLTTTGNTSVTLPTSGILTSSASPLSGGEILVSDTNGKIASSGVPSSSLASLEVKVELYRNSVNVPEESDSINILEGVSNFTFDPLKDEVLVFENLVYFLREGEDYTISGTSIVSVDGYFEEGQYNFLVFKNVAPV